MSALLSFALSIMSSASQLEPIILNLPIDISFVEAACSKAFDQAMADKKAEQKPMGSFKCNHAAEYENEARRGFISTCLRMYKTRAQFETKQIELDVAALKRLFGGEYFDEIYSRCLVKAVSDQHYYERAGETAAQPSRSAAATGSWPTYSGGSWRGIK